MKWKPAHSVIENARSVLPKLVKKYFEDGRKAADGKRSPDELHQFRIKTKRFRYTLELFLPAYGTRLDQELEPVRELQKVLGKLHDYHIIEQMLEGHKTLQTNLERRAKKKLKEFLEQWTTFDSNGALKRWTKLLAAGLAKSGAAHSKRRARKGSTAAARRAGTKLAKRPTTTTPSGTERR
jgi:CHAD domain-containing protein